MEPTPIFFYKNVNWFSFNEKQYEDFLKSSKENNINDSANYISKI